jgi:hypothetical protein
MVREAVPTLGWEVIASGKDGPGPRSRHCFVYDQSANAAVLFGGIIWHPVLGGTYHSDTWELHDRQWTRIKTSETPLARHRGAMVHLDNRRQSLLFGGQARPWPPPRRPWKDFLGDLLIPRPWRRWLGYLGDTWLYSDRQWQRIRTTGAAPSPRCGHCMAYEEQAGVAVLFGGISPSDYPLGDTWIFDGTHWESVSGPAPPARRYAAFAYDPDLKGCLLHGGAKDDQGRRTFGDAWLFRNNAWEKLGDDFATSPRDDHGLAYHRGVKRMVLLEGLGGARGILVREATGWRTVEARPLHPRHQCSPLVWDDALGGLLLHGGEVGHGRAQFDTTLLLRMSPAS